jgi:hypothetical protein
MTDLDVEIERPRRSRIPAALPLFGFSPRLLSAFVAAMMVFTYALMFARFGAFANPVEYLYPVAFVILVLLLLPGLLSVGAFFAMTGQPVDLDARAMVIIVAISALTYVTAWRTREKRDDQTP